ncbi:MFS transporter [Streptomyces sp. NBC_00483]|uniref:MFS transporter n=1 Tax=Streptomyces sp. NBC_00483 TaxID=2975756 RepID=UPI002E17BE05
MSTGRSRAAWVLVAVLLALLVLPTSVTGSGVALPHIARDTDASLASLQWVVHSYNLTFSSFMLACGSLADVWGRRRLFAAGAVLFTASSALSALVSDITVLNASRALAGIGAAALLTSGSAILSATFTGAARTRAFAAVGIVTGAGLALGAMAAGVLADSLGWRSFFGLHAILMALVACAIPAMSGARPQQGARVDWLGTVLFVTALFALMMGVAEGPQWGWSSPAVVALLIGSVVLFAAFGAVEKRVSAPMLDLALLRNARFMGLCLVPVAATFAFVILLPLLPNYLVVADGISSQAAGTLMLLMTLPILPTPMLAARLQRWGMSTRAVLGLSVLLLTAGVAWLALALHPGAGAADLAAPLIMLGVGLGLNFGLVDGAVLDVVEPQSVGTAAGFLNTLRLGSEAVAIAAAGAALVGLLTGRLADDGRTAASAGEIANTAAAGEREGLARLAPSGTGESFQQLVAQELTGAWQTVLLVSAALCAVIGVAVWKLLAPRRQDSAEVPAEQTARVKEAEHA